MRLVSFRPCWVACFSAFFLVVAHPAVTPRLAADVLPDGVRVIDSHTGCAIPDEQLKVSRVADRVMLSSPQYRAAEVAVPGTPSTQFKINVVLDPLQLPRELEPARLDALRSPGHMVIVGFVSDGASGAALEGVKVSAEPGDDSAVTDGRGFFELLAPVRAGGGTCRLVFGKPGYLTQRRSHVEVWPNGDWIYRISLKPGEGIEAVDERLNRRISSVPLEGQRSEESRPVRESPSDAQDGGEEARREIKGYIETSSGVVDGNETGWTHPSPLTPLPVERRGEPSGGYYQGGESLTQPLAKAGVPRIAGPRSDGEHGAEPAAGGVVSAVGSEDFVVRVPRTIRVLRQDGVTVDYLSMETYTKRVLPSEWVASWASFSGGINCLKAGAVAIRTFAAGYVSNPLAAGYDICGTTACQAYNPSANNSLANAAVDQTTGYVMTPPGAERITYKLTEYSAENNSTNLPCGDGYTSPVGGCLADPVCTGETRFGHGRGMCQWGSAKWATGLKFPGNDFPLDGSTTNGLPQQDWVWIAEHYYPHLELVAGTPLGVGDFVKVLGTSSLTVRECAGGSISGGAACPQVAAQPSGATGVIVGGPVHVVADGIGYTWWRVRWFDVTSTEGWSPENWLERTPEPPNSPPVLASVPPQMVNEGELLTIMNIASAPANIVHTIADFEGFGGGTVNGTVLFRQPRFSGSTSAQLEFGPNVSSVTDSFPAGNGSARVLRVNWSWLSAANTWLRLTTFDTANIPNPVISLDRTLSFDIHCDRDLRVAVGVRETGNPVGTLIGSDGGSTGGIETVGATNATSTPAPVRTVAAGAWTTVSLDLATEPVRSLAGGNGVLATATGLGTIENLSFVPASGSGAYDVYLDNFRLSAPNVLTYSLSNAPAGVIIDPASGVLTWTPTEAQGPGAFPMTVVVTDNNRPPRSDAVTFSVTVNEVNEAPVLTAVSNRIIHAGSAIGFTSEANDVDEPQNTLSFTLEPGAPDGATIGQSSGSFNWVTTTADAGMTNVIGIRVEDDGIPPLSDMEEFQVVVEPVPIFQTFTKVADEFELTWSAIAGVRYRVQYKTNLNQTDWLDLIPDVTATGSTASVLDPMGEVERYYRVLVVE